MSEILTKSQFARRLGRRPSSVSNWIARGHLTGDALTPDDRINVEEAERQLTGRLDALRSLIKMAASATAVTATAPSAPAPVKVNELAEIRIEQARRQLRRDRELDLERRGVYTRTVESERAHRRVLQEFVARVEQRLPELVTMLAGVDGKAGVIVARQWWRSLRQAEATEAAELAASLPQFVADAPDRVEK